jgi:hypothetical protein
MRFFIASIALATVSAQNYYWRYPLTDGPKADINQVGLPLAGLLC